jgi:hypothetical protein
MSFRFRHCIECPICKTRYLVGFSPYDNGSLVFPSVTGETDDWVLYCACQTPHVTQECHWSEMKICIVSKLAHSRGYGSPEEMVYLPQRTAYARI